MPARWNSFAGFRGIRIGLSALLLSVPMLPPSVACDESGQGSDGELRDGQIAVSGRYARFERLLSQMADILAAEDAERAELLRRAVTQGREQRIASRLESVVQLLESRELGEAVEQQGRITEGLAELLVLLQSEDRRSSVEQERERLNNLLQGVRTAIGEQRSARAATQNSRAPSEATPGQQQALRTTEDLLDQVKNHDAQQADTSGDNAGDNAGDESGETSSDSGTEGEATPEQTGETSPNGDTEEPDEGETPGAEGAESEGMPNENGESAGSSGEPQSGEPQSGESESQPSSGDSSSPMQTPGRQQLQAAQERMQRALQKLREQERDGAVEEQNAAMRELRAAEDALEEMLRQLREEEKELILATLEARLQRMLNGQQQIYDLTVELGSTPREQWLDEYYGRCRELARQQQELAGDGQETVALLREDGTSVTILLAMEDIAADMSSVEGRLENSQAEALTQALQEDIIDALKELIEVTQKEMEEMAEQQEGNPQQSSGGPQENPPLVELMAEIKVLRSLQLRVNRRTELVSGLLNEAGAEAEADDGLRAQLQELAERQDRLRGSARVLAEKLRAAQQQ